MSLYHTQAEESDVCRYCLELWPCDIGKALIEAANLIRDTVELDKAYRPKWAIGMKSAADLIDPRVPR